MRTVMPVILLMACAKGEPSTATDVQDTDTDTDTDTDSDTDADSDTDTDTDTDTDSDTDADSDTDTTDTGSDGCEAVTAGNDWAWAGACPGMQTPCELTVDACQLSIAYSSGMSMGMPTGGTVAGSDVTFDSGGCVGTVVDADTIEGTCSGGCTFTLTR